MASLNEFKTKTGVLTTTESVIYTAPSNYTTVVLMAQAANVTSTTDDVTFVYRDTDTSTDTELVKEFQIPGADSASLITGKLVVESGNSIVAVAGSNNSIKITLSLLETLNES